MVPLAERITPIASCSEKRNKIDFSDAMETEEEDTSITPKKQRVEET